jgi:enoyl-CoA hydratase
VGHQFVKFEIRDRVAVIELLPFEHGNEVAQLSQEIAECCQEFRMNNEISVLVVTERAPGVLAKENGNGSSGRESLQGYISISQSISECEKPVLIGILGDAVDLGLEMALACDVRVASENSRFGFRQVKVGLMPWDGGTQRLSRAVGKGKARVKKLDEPLVLKIGLRRLIHHDGQEGLCETFM